MIGSDHLCVWGLTIVKRAIIEWLFFTIKYFAMKKIHILSILMVIALSMRDILRNKT